MRVLEVPNKKSHEDPQSADRAFTVICVDDNPHVADAIRVKLLRAGDFEWIGWAADADDMLKLVSEQDVCPDLVILDLDMPGTDPFEASEVFAGRCETTRIVVFTGHVRRDLIERAVEAGAWGYVAKSDGADALVNALRSVMSGEFSLSPEVRSTYDRL